VTESTIVLGAMNFGTAQDDTTAFRLLDRFVDQGGRWIDTADCYAFWADGGVGGESEQLLGRWLAARPGMRHRVRISTKVGQQPTVAGRWPESAEGLSAAAIRAAIDLSRTRMGIDRIDMYWAHAEDRSVPLAETVGVFGELALAGVVGRLGASNHRTWRVERARNLAAQLGVPGFSALQLRHTYLQPRPAVPMPYNGHQLATEDSLDYAAADSALALWVYSPLLAGAYVRPERLEERYLHVGNERRLTALDVVAADLGVTQNQVVLAWLVGGDPEIWPIVGVSTEDQLEEALAGVRLELSAEHRAVLTDAA